MPTSNSDKQIKRVGRPSAKDENGAPQPVSDLPKLTIYITPDTKTRLNIVSKMQGEPVWRIVEVAVNSYLKNTLSQDQSKAIEKLLSS
jgi:hypothetical protein